MGLDECNKDNSKYTGENGVAAAGFRKGRRPGHMIAGWGANAGDEVFASLMADGTVDCESLSPPPPPNSPHLRRNTHEALPAGLLRYRHTSDVIATLLTLR